MREYMFAGKENMLQDISKERILESKLYEVLVETPIYDLLVMGRPEGPGCYCYTNNLLRGIMDRIIKNYDLTIIDTPAGLEHLSRGLIRDVDELLVVTDGSRRGIQTAERIRDLAGKLSLKIKKVYVLANKITPDSLERISQYASELGLEMIGAVSFDENIARYDLEGEPLAKLPEESVSVREIGRIAERIRG
jgi:CO dehydrogenase maturation factor